ncbi:hypothetical protein ACFYU8_18075 [Brevibacillus sp. NPDC003359]|uniref:hypothetical protein n=1 Tax=unclassified Brevibacillus TaxID=2684853 RepID=UPI00367C97B8
MAQIITSKTFAERINMEYTPIEHEEFIQQVRSFWEKEGKGVYNVKVFVSNGKSPRYPDEKHIAIAFDYHDIYVKMLSCSNLHEQGMVHVVEAGYNKNYVYIMSELI